MNFLAHCLIPDLALKDTHPDLIAGGFFGDFIKGPLSVNDALADPLPEDLVNGIRLHRRIDAFSNQLPGIRASCARFPVALRRFAPIFVDLVADHLLARAWARYHPQPLTSFSAGAYATIAPHVPRLPESGQRFYRYMSAHDLLARYRDLDTLHQSLGSVARRLKREPLTDSINDAVDQQLPGLAADFDDYFPALVAHANEWLKSRGYS